MSTNGEKSYVLFPLGEQRFALPADSVTELARPDTVQTFPHRTPLFIGVLVRRGRIVPVCDVAQVLVGPDAPARKFYLIAKCQIESRQETMAIPVTGRCELLNMEPEPPFEGLPAYISGVLAEGDETLEIVDLERLLSAEAWQ